MTIGTKLFPSRVDPQKLTCNEFAPPHRTFGLHFHTYGRHRTHTQHHHDGHTHTLTSADTLESRLCIHLVTHLYVMTSTHKIPERFAGHQKLTRFHLQFHTHKHTHTCPHLCSLTSAHTHPRTRQAAGENTPPHAQAALKSHRNLV